MTYPQILWTAQTKNVKTDNIPTMTVGATREESRESCEGCRLLDKACYSWNGTGTMARASMQRVAERDGVSRYSLEQAIENRIARAAYVRVTAIGDAGRADPLEVREHHDAWRAEGMGWLGYTHFPEEVLANGVSDLFCVSLEHPDVVRQTGVDPAYEDVLERVDYWLDNGFSRATVAMPDDSPDTVTTPGGKVGIWCPAQRTKNKVKCNDCGWCDPQAAGPDWVIFKDHGPQARGRQRFNRRGR